MKIVHWILRKFQGYKLPEKRYFDQTESKLDLPAITTDIHWLRENKAKFQCGTIKVKKKISIPPNVSDELIRLDQVQYDLALTINALSTKERKDRINQYVDKLFGIYTLSCQLNNNQPNTILNIDGCSLKQYLDDRHFKNTALPDDLSNNTGFVIWPVALLTKTTYIHKAQAQLIKLLADCGWKVLVIIGDCGKNVARGNATGFINEIQQILRTLNIPFNSDSIAKISDYYCPVDPNKNVQQSINGTQILTSFHHISEGLTWQQFDKLIKKNYDEHKKEDITKRTVLHNLQPLLTWSLVATIVKENHSKAIVIAGEDEKEQWDYITNQHTNNNLGVIYIHELKKGDNKTMDQEDIQIGSKDDMQKKLEIGNMAEWLYTHFIELPKFSTKCKPECCGIQSSICEKFQNNCIDCLFRVGKHFVHQEFKKDQFVSIVYPMSNPAN